jgi:hypothetical protein
VSRNLIITGGVFHPFDDSAPALAEILAQDAGIESTTTTDVSQGLAAIARGEYDLLTVYALRWPMEAEKFAADRAKWGHRLTDADKAAVEGHLRAGRGIFAVHTASICFEDWPRWGEIVGARWIWGRSFHPPYGQVNARIEGASSPLTAGLESFEINDEAYGNMDVQPDVTPLLSVNAQGQKEWWPGLWTRQVSGGRVAYDALGHDRGSLRHPTHRRIVARAALWALGVADKKIAEAA